MKETLPHDQDATLPIPGSGPTYWLHKVKCLTCSLHFIVCSDYEKWPHENGTTTPAGKITCPECTATGPFFRWSERVPGFIFEAVPGETGKIDLTPPGFEYVPATK